MEATATAFLEKPDLVAIHSKYSLRIYQVSLDIRLIFC